VRGLCADGAGGALAVVGGTTVRRRAADGSWSVLANSDAELSCCAVREGVVYAGTDDARVRRLGEDGRLEELPGFAHTPGRETWAAGQMLVDGKWLGPPLGVRSMTVTKDGALLANVHVGGIPRSTDAGASWQPSIAVDSDVHEVCAHPERAELAVAAAAVGLCVSRDGGASWHVEHAGLHAPYCAAVAFVEGDVLVSASEHHFSPRGRIYRRPIEGDTPLAPVAGLPEWTDGIVDTHGLAARGPHVALADRGGNLRLSSDAGQSWTLLAAGLSAPSGVLIV
jgi:hypothetical protein